MAEPRPAPHFATLAQQEHAAHLGMWVFLASESLLFAGLLCLYGAYRAHAPAAFALGVAHNTRLLGSINTAILLCSSYAAASAVHALRAGRRALSVGLLALTVAMGAGFLAIKIHEYALHFAEGIKPGGAGRFFVEHTDAGLRPFWTLYYLTTGLHAFHVAVGLMVLVWLAVRVARGRVTPEVSHPLALGAMYWHLVDVVWIFVWPLYYLTAG